MAILGESAKHWGTGCGIFLAVLLLSLFQSCSSEDDELVDPYTRAGIRHYVKGDYAPAVQTLVQAIEHERASYRTYHFLARAYLSLSKYGQAHQAIDQAIALAPQEAKLHETHGIIHTARYAARVWTETQASDAQEAIHSFKTAIGIEPRRANPYYNLGVMYNYLDSTRMAEKAFEAALAADSTLATAHKKLGMIYRQRGHRDKAVEALRQAVALAPSDGEAHYRLGLVYRDVRQFEEAATSLERAVELNPLSPKPRLTLGNIYMRLGRREEGLDQLRRSEDLRQVMEGLHREITPPEGLSLPIGSLKDHYNMGLKALMDGEKEAAELLFKQAIELDPNHRDSNTGLGMILAERGRFGEAALYWQKSAALDTTDPLGFARLAGAYMALGDYGAARAGFERATRLDTTMPEMYLKLGILAVRQDSLAAAVADFSRAIALDPGYVDAHLNLGVTHMKRGQIADATSAYEKVVALDPNNLTAHLYLSDAYRKLGQDERGKVHLERARELRAQSMGKARESGQPPQVP